MKREEKGKKEKTRRYQVPFQTPLHEKVPGTFWVSIFIFFLLTSFSFQDLDLPPSFPVDSPDYEISPEVLPASEPGFLKFHVTASHAEYDVEGFVPLAKLLHEIQVIERIKRDEVGGGFVDGAVGSVKETGEGFGMLVTHPVQSAKGIGQAAGKLGSKVGGIFKKKEKGEKSSLGEKMLGGSERGLANELGVDVYTENLYLRELLRSMARSRMGGEGAVAVVKFLVPVTLVASVIVTASGVNSAADQLVRDKDRGELFRLNREALREMQFSEREVKDFLSLPYYSPREATYFRFYLETLKGLEGFREIFHTAARSSTLWQARKILYAAQIAADEVAERPDFYRGIQIFDEGLALESPDKIIFITPYDVLDGELGEKVLRRSEEVKRNRSVSSLEIWTGGKEAPGFSTAAVLKGLKVKGWLLFE